MKRFEDNLKVINSIDAERMLNVPGEGKEVSTMIEIKYNENDIEGLEIFLRLINKLGENLNIKVI